MTITLHTITIICQDCGQEYSYQRNTPQSSGKPRSYCDFCNSSYRKKLNEKEIRGIYGVRYGNLREGDQRLEVRKLLIRVDILQNILNKARQNHGK